MIPAPPKPKHRLRQCAQPRSVMGRWSVFNAVGALGFALQVAVLALLTKWLDWNYLPATLLAVETAVFHNFVWHERWTWADRTGGDSGGAFKRFLRFNLTNGIFSIAGNLVLMRLFVGALQLDCLLANAISVGACSILNFAAGDRLVFRRMLPSKYGGQGKALQQTPAIMIPIGSSRVFRTTKETR